MAPEETDWYGPDSATFGDRLAAAREAARLTQSDLSRALGVQKTTLVKWENDQAEPRANKLQMTAGLLGVSISWLLTGEGDGAPPPDDANDPDLGSILSELRDLRVSMRSNADRAARLEKRIREAMRTDVEPAS